MMDDELNPDLNEEEEALEDEDLDEEDFDEEEAGEEEEESF